MDIIRVTCALIRNEEEHVLVVQRGENTDHPFKWEFPGGKVNGGESDERSILREISEEISLEIIITGSLIPVEFDYGFRKILLIPFVCDTLMALPVLNEHIGYRWVPPAELLSVDFSGADIPVAEQYVAVYGPGTKETEGEEMGQESIDEEGIIEMLAGKAGYASIDLLTESAIENSSVLRVLLNYSRGRDATLAFRAAYVVQRAAEKDEDYIKPYHTEIVSSMPSLKNESVIRSFLKIINLSGVAHLKEHEHGILADCSFNWLNRSESAIAIKAYSMEALYNLSLIYPELAPEIVASISRNMEDGSAGIKARGRAIMKKLAQEGEL